MRSIPRNLLTGAILLLFLFALTLLMSPGPILGIGDGTWAGMRLALLVSMFIGIAVLMLWLAIRLPKRPKTLVFALLAFLFIVFLYAECYQQCGLSGPDGRMCKDFGVCLYFSVITITTLGYGDFTPMPSARWIAATEALNGYLLLGLLVAALVAVMQRTPKEVSDDDDPFSD